MYGVAGQISGRLASLIDILALFCLTYNREDGSCRVNVGDGMRQLSHAGLRGRYPGPEH